MLGSFPYHFMPHWLLPFTVRLEINTLMLYILGKCGSGSKPCYILLSEIYSRPLSQILHDSEALAKCQLGDLVGNWLRNLQQKNSKSLQMFVANIFYYKNALFIWKSYIVEKQSYHSLIHSLDGPARHVTHVPSIGTGNPYIWPISCYFSQGIARALDWNWRVWDTNLAPVWHASITRGSFTCCTTTLAPLSFY